MIVGHYQIEQSLGSGSTGTVYKAIDLNTTQPVTIKFSTDSDSSKRIIHEGEMLKYIRHPNVVRLIEVGRDKKYTFLTREYLEGVKLNEIVPKELGLAFAMVLPIMRQICDGLQAVHDADIIHLDLKPSNIFLSKAQEQNDVVKIIDFGIAERESRKKKAPPRPLGTAGYVAPEQIIGSGSLGKRADIYSLGALLAFLLTGRRPFLGKRPEEIFARQLHGLVDGLNQSFLGRSSGLQAVVLKAMQIDPQKRYASASDFWRALEKYNEQLASTVKKDQ